MRHPKKSLCMYIYIFFFATTFLGYFDFFVISSRSWSRMAIKAISVMSFRPFDNWQHVILSLKNWIAKIRFLDRMWKDPFFGSSRGSGIAVTGEHMQPLVSALRRAWTCSDPEYVTATESMRFCGFEIKKIPGGFQVGQAGFATEMMKRRQVTGTAKFPLPAISDEEDEFPIDPDAVKKAQGIVGELNWLTTRSRPDLAFSVGLVARLIHRRPHYVLDLCEPLMKYVNYTRDLALVYVKCGEGNLGQHEELKAWTPCRSFQMPASARFMREENPCLDAWWSMPMV